MSKNLGYFVMNANSQMNNNAINSMISKNYDADIITCTYLESNLYAHSCTSVQSICVMF